jgi:hypothetical protein
MGRQKRRGAVHQRRNVVSVMDGYERNNAEFAEAKEWSEQLLQRGDVAPASELTAAEFKQRLRDTRAEIERMTCNALAEHEQKIADMLAEHARDVESKIAAALANQPRALTPDEIEARTDKLIERALAERDARWLDVFGKFDSQRRKQLRAEISAEIGQVRADFTIDKAARRERDGVVELAGRRHDTA